MKNKLIAVSVLAVLALAGYFGKDTATAEVAQELTQPVCVALFNALQVLPERRTAGLAQLRDQLSVTPQVSALVTEAHEDIAQDEEETEEEPKQGSRTSLIVMLIIIFIGYFFI